MRIFSGISSGEHYDTIERAVVAIFQRAQEQALTKTAWSLVELQPDNEDVVWLCDWARQLSSGVASRCLQEGQWRRFSTERLTFSYSVGIGTLLLMLATEVARRESTEGSLWAAICQGHFSETTRKLLFIQGHPTREHKDAIELAARWLNLRHVFGIEGLQNWYDTIYLQFGFAKQGFMRRLPEWLAGQGHTQAIQRLLSGPMSSMTFQNLWEALQNFRRKYITEEQLRSLLRNNSWVLPEWTDDLIHQARAKLHLGLGYEGDIKNTVTETDCERFLDTPALHWDPLKPPQFTCHLISLEKLDLSESTYDIIIAERRCGWLQKQSDKSYKAVPSDEIRLPIVAPLLLASLVAPNGQIIQSHPLQLWDENEDVTAFHASSGHRFDPWKNVMRPETAYILLLTPDLTVEPQPIHWQMLDHQAAKLFFLQRGWSPQMCVLLDGKPLWQPHLTPPSAVSEQVMLGAIRVQLYDPPQRLLFGEKIRLCIIHPRDITLSFIRSGGQPIEFVQHDAEHTITEPIMVRPSLFSRETNSKLELILGVRNSTTTVPIHYTIDLYITGAAILTQGGWTALDGESTLTVEQAKIQPIKIFLMDIEKWVLMEGDTIVGRLWMTPHPIGTLTGLGAPLSIQEGSYNALNEPLPLTREVVDYGSIAEVAVDAIDAPVRTLSIRLARSIEPDEHYTIIWWDKDGSFHAFLPECNEMQEHEMWWLSSVPQDLTQPLAVAIAYDGVRIGVWWDTAWSRALRSTSLSDSRTTAAMLRWFQLPLLSNRFRGDVEQFVHAYPCNVLTAWVGEVDLPLNLSQSESGDGWLSAIRTIFRHWEPNIGIAPAIILHLAAPDMLVHEQLLGAIWQLCRISPLLMGKVLQRWIEDVGIPQGGTCMAQALVRFLLYKVVDAETDKALLQAKKTLQENVAETMSRDPFFIEKALIQRALSAFQGQPVSSIDDNNIAVAISNWEPFRRLLSVRILELINQTLNIRR